MPLAFSTKAATLASLQEKITTARIAPLAYFTVAEWRANRSTCIAQIQAESGEGPWIVRSSCRREDRATESNAGAFLSLLNTTQGTLETAVEQIIDAYGDAADADEVLVQPMLREVVRSGVAFSHDPNVCAPLQSHKLGRGR